MGSTLGLGLGLQRAGRLGLGLGLAVDVSLFGTRAPGSCVVGLREPGLEGLRVRLLRRSHRHRLRLRSRQRPEIGMTGQG